METWVVPISAIPAVGIFVMSTTNLLAGLSQELSQLDHENPKELKLAQAKLPQLRRLTRTLTVMYCAGILFAISALIMGVPGIEIQSLHAVTTVLLCAGISLFVIGFGLLIAYAIHATRIKQDQFR